MSIGLVVCVNESFQIGNSKNNDLLYKISHDMSRFKSVTMGHYVAMGRNTFYSLPAPLKGRVNVVFSKNHRFKIEDDLLEKYDIIVENDFEKVLNNYKYSGEQEKDFMIIGGSFLFSEGIHWCDNIYLTMVHDKNHPDGDIYFPKQELSEFKEAYREKHYDEESGLWYSFIDYVRK